MIVDVNEIVQFLYLKNQIGIKYNFLEWIVIKTYSHTIYFELT